MSILYKSEGWRAHRFNYLRILVKHPLTLILQIKNTIKNTKIIAIFDLIDIYRYSGFACCETASMVMAEVYKGLYPVNDNGLKISLNTIHMNHLHMLFLYTLSSWCFIKIRYNISIWYLCTNENMICIQIILSFLKIPHSEWNNNPCLWMKTNLY